ncbi:S-layer homology domain-containing protein [Paenibacillus allorhizosphaerae]|uniref:SLH domain-containing protein n=1 Tax=Paenibacillus allorhizosphaerae TaxID=2849866 RepID=A0ABM8VJM5_9BACL|nr:S-layer homology domain-containing protein [Paenibacillus allorhizosphaerae]CAG7645721.1 hypothetical protein PAECIP111802_03587 [Paenibacillus allorhizosphaerae]
MLFKSVRSKISAFLIFSMLASTFLPVLASGAEAEFKDIAESYAQREIMSLAEAGIISGYEDGYFQPRKEMTRAELAKIIALTMGLKENANKAVMFKDVDATSWYAGYVGSLVEHGIAQGTSETSFSPDAKVTREELVVFFIRALGLENAANQAAVELNLSDIAYISSWAKADVLLAFQLGLANGIENSDGTLRFDPKNNAERQALARLAYEISINKAKFVDRVRESGDKKATSTEEAVTATELPTVSNILAVDNTSVEVTFGKSVESADKADFTFDNGLNVTQADIDAGDKSAVLLTTTAQMENVKYKLFYKGKDTGKTVFGVAAPVSGGSSSDSGSDSSDLRLPSVVTDGDNVTINEPGVTLSDMVIAGDLIISKSVGNGEVYLKNVTVKGKTYVYGGGENSIHLENAVMLTVIVDKKDGTVRLVASGKTVVQEMVLQTGAKVETNNGTSINNVTLSNELPSGTRITLSGGFETVNVNASGIKIELPSGSIQNVNVASNAGGTVMQTSSESTIVKMILNAAVSILGQGTIKDATINAAGVTMDKAPTNMTVGNDVPIDTPINIGGCENTVAFRPTVENLVVNVGEAVYATSPRDGVMYLVPYSIKVPAANDDKGVAEQIPYLDAAVAAGAAKKATVQTGVRTWFETTASMINSNSNIYYRLFVIDKNMQVSSTVTNIVVLADGKTPLSMLTSSISSTAGYKSVTILYNRDIMFVPGKNPAETVTFSAYGKPDRYLDMSEITIDRNKLILRPKQPVASKQFGYRIASGIVQTLDGNFKSIALDITNLSTSGTLEMVSPGLVCKKVTAKVGTVLKFKASSNSVSKQESNRQDTVYLLLNDMIASGYSSLDRPKFDEQVAKGFGRKVSLTGDGSAQEYEIDTSNLPALTYRLVLVFGGPSITVELTE